MFRVRYLNKDVILGVVALIVLIAAGLFAFQLGGNRDSSDITLTTDLSEIPRIGVDELKRKVDMGSNLVIIDTRSKEAYEQMHIAGSISVPLEKVAEHYTELKVFEEIFTYCTCPDEATSARAAQILEGLGLPNVKAIIGGLTAWKGAGYPVESTNNR